MSDQGIVVIVRLPGFLGHNLACWSVDAFARLNGRTGGLLRWGVLALIGGVAYYGASRQS